MQKEIDRISGEINGASAKTADEVEKLRLAWLGKNGSIQALFAHFRKAAPEEKKKLGAGLNSLKQRAQDRLEELKAGMGTGRTERSGDNDLTLPGDALATGSRHPISIVREEIAGIFARMGFTVSDGPEIESDWYNFTALNMPEDHPARDMQDTFFVHSDPDIVLRTHTSSVQVRVMESTQPPIRTISPGRVFRNEAISARAHCIFHQVEGLCIDTDVSFADLKQALSHFARELFGEGTRTRLRPSYFPFTEPSAEMDISCNICGGKGCNVCKHTGWVEILGCGMVDPGVLENCRIDSAKYTGYAFGMGIERIAMLKYRISDLRLFFENDVRFLEQFRMAL